jgi:hypothetical protein
MFFPWIPHSRDAPHALGSAGQKSTKNLIHVQARETLQGAGRF